MIRPGNVENHMSRRSWRNHSRPTGPAPHWPPSRVSRSNCR